jgi:hypothetical protein
MKQSVVVIVVTIFMASIAIYIWRDRLPIMRMAVRAHAARGSIDCGTVSNIGWINAEEPGRAAVNCAVSAAKQHKPFYVVFTEYGADVRISHALISDGSGRSIQLVYASGTVNSHALWKSRCEEPLKVVVEETTPYSFPRVHCAPWPPSEDRLSRDFLLW